MFRSTEWLDLEKDPWHRQKPIPGLPLGVDALITRPTWQSYYKGYSCALHRVPITGSPGDPHHQAVPHGGRHQLPCVWPCHERDAALQPGGEDPGRELHSAGRGGLALWPGGPPVDQRSQVRC